MRRFIELCFKSMRLNDENFVDFRYYIEKTTVDEQYGKESIKSEARCGLKLELN